MECRYYQRLSDGRVECLLCPHHCKIVNGKTGICRSRRNESDDIYMKVSGGHLLPVLDTILAMKEAGVWIELTNLIIPGINDDMQMIRQMCQWIVSNGLADNPLHFSRFFPRFKMQDVPPTPIHTLKEAKQTALEEGIKNVYLGNV